MSANRGPPSDKNGGRCRCRRRPRLRLRRDERERGEGQLRRYRRFTGGEWAARASIKSSGVESLAETMRILDGAPYTGFLGRLGMDGSQAGPATKSWNAVSRAGGGGGGGGETGCFRWPPPVRQATTTDSQRFSLIPAGESKGCNLDGKLEHSKEQNGNKRAILTGRLLAIGTMEA